MFDKSQLTFSFKSKVLSDVLKTKKLNFKFIFIIYSKMSSQFLISKYVSYQYLTCQLTCVLFFFASHTTGQILNCVCQLTCIFFSPLKFWRVKCQKLAKINAKNTLSTWVPVACLRILHMWHHAYCTSKTFQNHEKGKIQKLIKKKRKRNLPPRVYTTQPSECLEYWLQNKVFSLNEKIKIWDFSLHHWKWHVGNGLPAIELTKMPLHLHGEPPIIGEH